MVLRVDGRQHTQGAEDRGQQDVSTAAKKLGEGHSRARNDQAAQSAEDQQFDVSSPRRSRPANVASTSSPPTKAARVHDTSTRSASPAKPVRSHGHSHGHSHGNSARQGSLPDIPADQLDAAAAVFASLPRPGAAGRPAPISTNAGGSSPTQDQPRGWQAMLQSPSQHDDQLMTDHEQHVPTESGQEPLPVLSPAADGEPVRQSPFGGSAASAGPAPAPAGPVSGGAGRPSPLVLPGEITVSPASRFHNLRLVSPAAGAPPFRPPAMVRLDLTIQTPPSPRDAGCVTPTAMHSPSRPYHGPRLSEAEVDYDLIDGIALADGSTPNSSGSSPSLASAAGSAAYTRSGGLRSSRDTDLRRVAMANQLLHSPRPPNSLSGGGPQPMFASDTRARAIAAGAPPTARDGGSEPASQPASETAVMSSETPPPTAAQLQRLYQQSLRGSQGSSPASAASPAGPSILAGASGARSLPGTPGAALQHRSSSGGPVAISSSRSSSMTASPVPPPTHGPAAALLAGAVGASPSTPRSPLSVMYSPYSGRTMFSSGGTPLPPPLFSGANSGGGSGAAGSPLPAAAGSAALPPSGRSSISNIAMFSPPATSRLRREFSGPVATQELPPAPPASGLGGETVEPLQPMDVDGEHLLQQQPQQSAQRMSSHPTPMEFSTQASDELAVQSLGLSTLSRQGSLQQPSVPEHYPQVLRHRLQVTDTRFGPHGESPLSPSHHSHMQQMQQQSHGESLLSPTRPTPLVQPALVAAAAAASGVPDAAAAAASAAAAAHAAGRAVGVVGRRDVHEWLDQHSWPFLYELPHNLRDTADFARSQRLGRPQADPGAAAAHDHVAAILQQQEQGRPAEQTDGLLGTTSGEQLEQLSAHLEAVGFPPDGQPAIFRPEGQQLEAASYDEAGSAADSRASTQAPQASRHQSRLADLVSSSAVPSIASVPAPAVGPSSSRPLDWAFGGLRVSVDQSGPAVSSLGSSGTSRFGPQTYPGPSILRSARGDGPVPGRSRPGSVLSRHSASSIGDVCTPAVGVQLTADSSMAGQAGSTSAAALPVQEPFSSSMEAPEDAAAATDGNAAHRLSGSSSASARLLSPGSHLYMPGSPVADHIYCSSCPPVPLNMQVGLPAAAVWPRYDSAIHSSSTNNATAAAELLRSSMAAVAAAQESVPVLNRQSSSGRYRRRSTHGDIQSTEQPPESVASVEPSVVTDLAEADSAVDAGMVELSPATPALQSINRLLDRAPAPQRRQQQLVLQTQIAASAENGKTTAAAAMPAVPAAAASAGGSNIDAAGVMSLIRDQLLQQTEGAVDSHGHDVKATSAGQPSLNRPAVLLALLSDQQYMRKLLSALPGVNPGAPEVQHAVLQLQEALKLQSGLDLDVGG